MPDEHSSGQKRTLTVGKNCDTEPPRKIVTLSKTTTNVEWRKVDLNVDTGIINDKLLYCIQHEEHIDELDLSRRSFDGLLGNKLVSLCTAALGVKKVLIRDIEITGKLVTGVNQPIIKTLSDKCPELVDIDITGCSTSTKKYLLGDESLCTKSSTHFGVNVHDYLQGNDFLNCLLTPSKLQKSAITKNAKEIMRLVDSGVPANCSLEGWGLLDTACATNDEELTKWLVERIEKQSDNVKTTKCRILGPKDRALRSAAVHNGPAAAKVLLRHNTDANARDEGGWTALHWAAEHNSHDTVRVLLEHNADVDAKDKNRWTALHWTTQNNNYESARVLLKHNADVNAKDNNGWTTLHWTTENNNYELARVLLEHKADVNAKDKRGWTALHWAAKYNSQDTVRVLLELRADVNAKNCESQTTLQIAAENNNYELVLLLLEYNADVNAKQKKGWTALHFATKSNVVQVLLEHNADVSANDKCDWTALHWAAKNNRHNLIRVLAENKADVNGLDRWGQTALHVASKNNNTDAVRMLLLHNADVNVKDKDGQTALHWAVKSGKVDTVQMLVENDVDISAKNKDGQTALHLSAEHNNLVIAELLLHSKCKENTAEKEIEVALNIAKKKGNREFIHLVLRDSVKRNDCNALRSALNYESDPNFMIQNGSRLLYMAVGDNSKEIANLLLDHGADAIVRDESSTRLLHYAIKLKETEIVKLLLDKGANPNCCNGKGEAALYVALQSANLAIARLLLENGATVNTKNTNGETHLMFFFLQCLQMPQTSSDILRLLVEFGADLTNRNADGETLLHVFFKHLAYSPRLVEPLIDVASLLLDESYLKILSAKSRDNSGNSPLHLWSQLVNSDEVTTVETESFIEKTGSILFAHGAPVNATNDFKQAPLHLARSWSAVNLLLQNDAERNNTDVNGNTPLLSRVKELKSNSTFLYEPKNSQDKSDKQIRTLLEFHVDPWIENKQGETVFSMLIDQENFELSKTFVEVVANINPTRLNVQNSRGNSPLHLACRSHNPESYSLINILLSVSADPNMVNKNKETPLHVACKRALESAASESVHIWVVNNLLDYGASTTMEDEEGRSCRVICEANDKLMKVLNNPKQMMKPTQILRWCMVSEKHKSKLAKVSCGQRYRTAGQYHYHEEMIGSGAFSQVYAGINKKDGREVALKRLDKMRLKRPEDRREISSLVKLVTCDPVVSYIDWIEEKETIFIILELMEGTLEEYLDVRRDSTYDVSLCNDVMRGLDFLHQHNPPVVHRDIKPRNVLYKTSPRLCLKIADFGLSTKADPDATESTVGTGSAFSGTRCWMAPEVLDNKVKHSTASDVFASGIVLHTILTEKKHPFAPKNTTGRSKADVSNATERNIIHCTFTIDDKVSPEAKHLIRTMLDNDMSKRPHTSDILAHPFFWSCKKKHDFLNAVGNQPVFQAPRGMYNPTPVEVDLENILGIEFSTTPWNTQIPAIYNQVTASPRSPRYNTSSAVSLVRFVRNTLAHVSDRNTPTTIKELVLQEFEILRKFPNLLLEVYKAIVTHGFIADKEIQYVITNVS